MVVISLASELGDAEVGDAGPLDPMHLPRGHQNIRGLDVAMYHAFAVRVTQRFGNLLADFAHPVERIPLALLDDVGQRSAVDKLHHQKGRAFVLAHVKDRHDSGMRQNARCARLAVESRAILLGLRAFERRGMDGLESHEAAYGRVARLEDATHRALAQLLDNLIPSNHSGCVHGVDCINPRGLFQQVSACKIRRLLRSLQPAGRESQSRSYAGLR